MTQHNQYYIPGVITFMSVNAFSYADINDKEWLSRDQSTICRFEPNDWPEVLKFDLNESIDHGERYDDWNGLEPFDVSYNNPVVKLAIVTHKKDGWVDRIIPIF